MTRQYRQKLDRMPALILPISIIVIGFMTQLQTDSGAQERNLSADQKHELEMFHKMGGVGEPTSFGQRFVKAERPGLANTWSITFTYEVTDKNLEKTANEIAKKFGIKIKRGGLMKGDYARMAVVTGPEKAMIEVSKHALVRRVEQDSEGAGGFDKPITPRSKHTPPPPPQ
jgi:hypothetical protein